MNQIAGSNEPEGRRSAEAEDAFARYLAACAAAEAEDGPLPDFEEWVRRHPHVETELRQLESGWRGFDALLKGALDGSPAESLFHRTPHGEGPPRQFLQFEADRLVGDFRLIQRIGQGGMGEVWQAEQVALRRQVALKFIRPDRLNQRSEAFFDREARASARLNHPGIVAVYGSGTQGELRWIAQELVPGSSTLKDFLRAAGTWERFPDHYFQRTARFMAELCDALQVAHAASVIHRDIKPQNILVTSDDRPKLTDFGLARLTDEAAVSGTWAIKGTPVYMSPEQVLGKSQLIDHRADVYGAGAVLFELLTLKRPFDGETAQVMRRILDEDPVDPTAVRPEVPADLAAIALRALERRPSDRYRTAGAMADDLRRFLAGEPVHARPPGPLKCALRWSRRHLARIGVALLAVLLVLSLVLLGGAARRAAESSVEARKEVMLSRAWRAIDAGDLERAREETDAFKQSFPDDPSGSLVMVAGYAQNLRVQAMEDELTAVAQLELPEGSSPAFKRLIAGLRLVAGGRLSDYPVVLEHLETAMDLDPDLETVVLYPIYQMRRSLGDDEGAAEALEAYRGVLRTSSPVVHVVDALLLEVQGQPAAGADRLRELIAEVGEATFVGISGFRELGRMELLAFTQDPDRGERLDAALETLQLAVEEQPADKGAWANLALARLRKHDRTPSADQRKEWLALTDEAVRRCLELAPGESTALEVLVQVVWNRLDSFLSSPGAVEALPVEAELVEVIERLEAVKPESPLVDHGRSMLAYFRGVRERSAGRMDPAYRFLLEGTRGNDLNISAYLELGQIEHMHRKDFGAALKAFLAAESAWEGLEELGLQPGRSPLFSARVWAFGAADHAGELDLAYEYRERALEMLEEPGGAEIQDLCNLAEFLAAPANLELRDCDATRHLLAQHPIAETLVELSAAQLELIRSACGE